VGDRTEERIARNNAIFREANQKIRASADRYDADLDPLPFICECAAPDCTEILRLTRREYRDVRQNDRRFLTAVGHEQAEGARARVVSRGDRYLEVEKPLPMSVGRGSFDES
jgi:hypothetical protein